MRIGFVTSVELGLSCLRTLCEAGARVDFAMTLPDEKARAKSGRVYIDDFCRQHDIRLFKVPSINDPSALEILERERPDVLFIIGWSQIAHAPVLDRVGMAIGIHPTLLPEGRGRAAIPWAIIKGLRETGVTLFVLDAGVDTGDIIAQRRLPVAEDETATSLYERVTAAHVDLIREAWPSLAAGTPPRTPQDDSQATLWPGRTPADGLLRPDMTVTEAERLVRATTRPYPGAFARNNDGGTVRVWAGKIGNPGVPPAQTTYRIQLIDGVYDALDWELES